MDWGVLITGFILGTWKFMFGHWIVFGAYGVDNFAEIIAIFASVTFGAWTCMSVFYFSSNFFMRRAHIKRKAAYQLALDKGVSSKKKKVFTKMNRGIVWVKMNIGIYGLTFLAPLFLSIPIGAIVCAKFYGKSKITFPLMMFYTAAYSAIMCLWIYSVN
jgi:hypothetical protein